MPGCGCLTIFVDNFKRRQTMTTLNIAIFASGNGTNAESIMNDLKLHPGCGLRVALVVTNRADAPVIGRACRFGVPVEVMTRKDIESPDKMDEVLDRYSVDVIVLAGFLLMIPQWLVERFPERIVNIHPSLLPKYGGKGMYGHHVHEAVAVAGERQTGITVHYVNNEYDRGRIIFQATVDLLPTDTVADIEAKIHTLEQTHFARVVRETFGR